MAMKMRMETRQLTITLWEPRTISATGMMVLEAREAAFLARRQQGQRFALARHLFRRNKVGRRSILPTKLGFDFWEGRDRKQK